MKLRHAILGILIIALVTGCGRAQRSTVATAASLPAAATPTRERASANATTRAQLAATATMAAMVTPARSTPAATAMPVASPTIALPTAAPAASPGPTATALPSAGANVPVNPPAAVTRTSGVLLVLDPRKYPVPALLAPENNATYHVSQPVVHLAWSTAPTELMEAGQMPGCVSDATNFRRAFESYQLVIHSLDVALPDIVQWNENNPAFDLDLTTVPAGRYSWTVSVVTLCESYVVGKRNSTITRSFVGSASPSSAPRSINWVP